MSKVMSKMATNNPEVVAWRWRKPVVNNQGETIGETAWVLGDKPSFLQWWTNEPLVRLSDYKALQAKIESKDVEIARLREALEEVRSLSTIDLAMNPNPYALTAMLGYIYQIADAALAKENKA